MTTGLTLKKKREIEKKLRAFYEENDLEYLDLPTIEHRTLSLEGWKTAFLDIDNLKKYLQDQMNEAERLQTQIKQVIDYIEKHG